MKYVRIISAVVATTFLLASCGGDKKETSENVDQPVQEEAPVEKITYEPFDKEKLQGKWTVIDGAGYSKDQAMGKTYEFNGDTATFYKNTGDGGMATGYYEIAGEGLNIEYRKKGTDGSNVRITFEYTGGFFENGTKLQMDADDMKVTLKKQ